MTIDIIFDKSSENSNGGLSGLGISYKGQGATALFSDPENELAAEKYPVPPSNPIVEISVGYNDDNIE